MSCGVGHRLISDPTLLWLWLWYRPAATALIQLLDWEPPYAAGVAQEMAKKDKQTKNKETLLARCLCVCGVHFFNCHEQEPDSNIIFLVSPAVYGGSQARGQIGAVATSLHHSHSNAVIRAASTTYTTAHSNAGSLTH